MKRSTIIKRLNGLAELYDQASALVTGNVGEWVGLGLFNQDELNDWLKGSQAESEVYAAGRQAEDAVPKPDFYANPEFPKEYLALVERMAELSPFVTADKRARDILQHLKARGFMGSRTIGERLGLAEKADHVFKLLRDAEDDYQSEYYHLDERKQRKERDGSIVRRIRHKLSDELEAARKKARQEAQEKAAAERAALIQRKKELDVLIERRRADKLRPIAEAVDRILEGARQRGTQ